MFGQPRGDGGLAGLVADLLQVRGIEIEVALAAVLMRHAGDAKRQQYRSDVLHTANGSAARQGQMVMPCPRVARPQRAGMPASGDGSNPIMLSVPSHVRPGHMGDRTYLRHG